MPNVAYGNEHIDFETEPGDTLTEKEPDNDVEPLDDDDFRKAFEAARFDDFLGHGKPLVVVNDAFRPTPTGQVLSQINSWYPDFRADFIVACGNHPAPDSDDLAEIFRGYALPSESKVMVHDSQDLDSMEAVGELDGQTLYVNRSLFEYPAVLIIGSVEPHYFAGYTGGRKSLVPGLSDIEINRANHARAVSAEAQPLRLKGNPVAENLDRLLELINLPNLLSIQLVTGCDQKIRGCFVGSLAESFAQAVTLAERIYSFECRSQYDLVIAEARKPLDRNLYQLQKAIENTAGAVRDGGTLLAVSECREGIGNDEFYRLAGRLSNEDMVLSHADIDDPPLGIHKLSRIIGLKKRISIRVLSGIKNEILEQVYLEPAVSIEAEIQKLKQGDKKEIDILLVRDAGHLAAKLD